MIDALLLAATLAAPLSTNDALTLLTGPPPALVAALEAKCKKTVTTILAGSVADVAKLTKPTIACVRPHFPALAKAIDAQNKRCASTEPESCESWVAHARASLLDSLGAEEASTHIDFARLMATLTAALSGDKVDSAAANRAIAAGTRLGDAMPENGPVQRLLLAAWMSLPASGLPNGEAAFTGLVPRVLESNRDDPEVWGAFTVIAERAKVGEAVKEMLDALAKNATDASRRGTAYFLRGCAALHENDMSGAYAAFGNAAKADPFNGTYRAAMNDANVGKKYKCTVTMSPFANPLKLTPQ